MKKISFILALLIGISSIGYADWDCVNTTHEQYTTTIVVSGNSIPVAYNESCITNCSTTLNRCRMDDYTQMSVFVGIIIVSFMIMFFGYFIGRRFLMLDFPLYAVMMMFFALMGGYFDVFLAKYNTIFLAFVFIPAGFFFASLWSNMKIRKEKKGEPRATGRF